jgi:LPXTG-site transpeptidase (sortase) family protein
MFMVGMAVIYRPVVSNELKRWLLPDFSFAMVTPELMKSYAIVIPKLKLQERVTAGVDPTSKVAYIPALTVGVAQAAGTALPGEGGVGYYFAHSSGTAGGPQQRAEFYLLGQLVPGDEVQVFYRGQEYRYTVTDKRVVWPNDVSFLHDGNTGDRIVLQTCWPIGTDLQRLLVFAERVK